MSDPQCKTCKYFNPQPLAEWVGICRDTSKTIRDSNGNSTGDIETYPNYSCTNHNS